VHQLVNKYNFDNINMLHGTNVKRKIKNKLNIYSKISPLVLL